MACVLRVIGEGFDPDAFLKNSRLSPSKVWRRGERRLRGRVHESQKKSGMTVLVSDASMSDLGRQSADAVAFLKGNNAELARLVAFDGVEAAGLDFAVSWSDDAVTHSDHIPAELVRLAGALGLDLELSHYPLESAGSS